MTTKNDGGPAFPLDVVVSVKGGSTLEQKDIDFLEDFARKKQGMSLRQWYAGQALASIKPPDLLIGKEETKRDMINHAKRMFSMADAMIMVGETTNE